MKSYHDITGDGGSNILEQVTEQKDRIGQADVALDLLHRHQPQQSDLKPQTGQRQTACMRYVSAPQRSHSVLSWRAPGLPADPDIAPPVVVEPGREVSRIGVMGRGEGPESAMAAIIAETAGLPGSQVEIRKWSS